MNTHRLKLREWLDDEGYETFSDAIESGVLSDSVVPALCDEGCEVEPDGRCQHGCPSVLLACGII